MGSKLGRSAVVLTCLLVAGCALLERNPEPGTTGGQIMVGTPRVSGRERLINDRRAQEEWLQSQLATVDQQRFDTNAGIDTRSLAAVAAGVALKADPSVAVSRAQQAANLALVQQQATSAIAAEQVRTAAVDQVKVALAKGEIDAKEASTRIQALGIDYPKLNSAVPAAVPSPSASGAGAAAKMGTLLLDALKANQLNPPSPTSAALANVVASPIDLFRDKLALREEIRNEMNENALDETHDLHRHTLYRLTFDATLMPDNDTSAWAVISASLVPPTLSTETWGLYRKYLEERLQAKFQERVRLLSAAMPSCNQATVQEQVKCAAPKVFSSRVSSQVLAMLANYRSVTAKLESEDLSATYRLFAQTSKSYGPVNFPTPRGASLSEAERVLFQVLAMVLLQDFTTERLNCYYRLRSTTLGGGDYPPPMQGSSLNDYGIEVSAPDFGNDPNASPYVAAMRNCGYRKGVPKTFTQVSEEFAAAISTIVQPKVYAVTPKEAVQRISDVSSRRAASEFVAGLSALAGVGAIDAMIQTVRVNDTFLQALRRQPLVVGFSSAPTENPKTEGPLPDEASPVAKFGWVLGPTFSIVNDGKKPAFRHTVRQQAVTAAVSVPSWWDRVTIDMSAGWRRENGLEPEFRSRVFSAKYSVPLPRKLSALDGIFVDSSSSREPEVDTLYTTTVQVGQPARFLIRGDNIWRATEILLGSQPANRVRLLPDMRGVIAEFDEVSASFGSNTAGGAVDKIDVSVATSDGFAQVGSATVVSASALSIARTVTGFGRRIAADQTVILAVTPPLKSFRTAELWAKSKANATLNIKLADANTGMEVGRDGGTIRVAPFGTNLKLKNGDSADLYLVIMSDSANQPEYVAVASDAVYFEKLSDAAAKVEWAASGAGLRDVKLTFPPGATVAFNALKTGSATVTPSATMTDGRSIAMSPVTCKVEKTPCTFKPHLAMPIKTEDAAALKAGDFSLALKVAGADAPDVAPAALAGK